MGGIFKAYDIRGSYPAEIDETTSSKIGTAFANLLKAERIVIGRDMRLSSPALAEAFAEGVMLAGTSVVDVGMSTTPMLYYSTIAGDFDGGVMVTASHLPGGMNGFKLCGRKAVPLSEDSGLPAIENIMRAGLTSEFFAAHRGSLQHMDMRERYIESLSKFVRGPAELKVVVDAGNGTAGPEVELFFDRNPAWALVPMYVKPDGEFPAHEANPLLPSATEELQTRVVRERADIGVAFDGDADRCMFIDENGERIRADLALALLAEYYLEKVPGSAVMYDLRSSRIVAETITRLGGRALRSRVGHAFIKVGMREVDALLAGELSGHFYFRDMGYTDNAMFAVIQILNLLSAKGIPVSEMVRPLEKYHSTGEINMQVADKDAVIQVLERKYMDAARDYLDGLTVEYPEWWFNVRPSNTEPVIRMNLEAVGRDLLETKKEEILRTIREIEPAMSLSN